MPIGISENRSKSDLEFCARKPDPLPSAKEAAESEGAGGAEEEEGAGGGGGAVPEVPPAFADHGGV